MPVAQLNVLCIDAFSSRCSPAIDVFLSGCCLCSGERLSSLLRPLPSPTWLLCWGTFMSTSISLCLLHPAPVCEGAFMSTSSPLHVILPPLLQPHAHLSPDRPQQRSPGPLLSSSINHSFVFVSLSRSCSVFIWHVYDWPDFLCLFLFFCLFLPLHCLSSHPVFLFPVQSSFHYVILLVLLSSFHSVWVFCVRACVCFRKREGLKDAYHQATAEVGTICLPLLGFETNPFHCLQPSASKGIDLHL